MAYLIATEARIPLINRPFQHTSCEFQIHQWEPD